MTQEITGSNKEKHDKTLKRKDNLSGFLYDLAKACFTLMVIAGLWMFFTQGFTWGMVAAVALGLASTFGFAYFANRIMIY